jgi:hypothetical protein
MPATELNPVIIVLMSVVVPDSEIGDEKMMVSELLPVALFEIETEVPLRIDVTVVLAGMSPADPVTALPMLIPLTELNPLIVMLLFVIPILEIG